MADIQPFSCIRPAAEYVKKVAALPYDVYSREEALKEVKKEPLSFLNIDRAETQFDKNVSMYDDRVYEKANELLEDMIQKGILIEDTEKCYYIYELIMEGRHQTGIVAVASIDDYINHTIKTHEDTREDKELDRIKHVDICNAQTGPIFLTYRHDRAIQEMVQEYKKRDTLYSFEATDHIIHNVWKITDKDIMVALNKAFMNINSIYIADGHHRAASAVKVGLMRRNNEKTIYIEDNCVNEVDSRIKNNSGYNIERDKINKEYDYFLSVLFPDNELMIYPYFRVVKDLNGHFSDVFLEKVGQYFDIECRESEAYIPEQKMRFGMLLDDKWYKLSLKEDLYYNRKEEFVQDIDKLLDVSILQDYILDPILMIKDPRTDKRIDFVGGIRGVEELEKRTKADIKVAFTLYPTSIEELFQVSDSDKRMPPKSTWFEPKLRSGLFIHRINS